jgi:hypothetical protein
MSIDDDDERLLSAAGSAPLHPNHIEPMEVDDRPTVGRGSRKWLAAAAGVVVIAGLAASGVAVARLSGSGAQPEDVVPSNAIAFVKLDLDPSVGQKVAVLRLAAKFPKTKSSATGKDGSPKQSIFGSIFTGKDSHYGLEYKTDVEPWLGDRAAVVVVPDSDGDKKPEVGLVVAVTHEDKAKAALAKAKVNNARNSADGMGYAFADGFVVVSDSDAHASEMVTDGKNAPLKDSQYGSDVKTLDGDQVAVAWADLGALGRALQDKGGDSTYGVLRNLTVADKVSGRIVAGLHVTADFVELSGQDFAFGKPAAAPQQQGATTDGLAASFPADSLGAVSATGLGHLVGSLYTSMTSDGDPFDIKGRAASLGIESASDVETLLGAETGVVVAGSVDDPSFAVRTRSSSAQGAKAVADRVLDSSGMSDGVLVSQVEDPAGLVVGLGSDDALVTALVDKATHRLGDDPTFLQVVPDRDHADFIAFVNLSKVLPQSLDSSSSADEQAAAKTLKAVGFAATGGSAPTFRMRLSVN